MVLINIDFKIDCEGLFYVPENIFFNDAMINQILEWQVNKQIFTVTILYVS